jgi:hypothetical protein
MAPLLLTISMEYIGIGAEAVFSETYDPGMVQLQEDGAALLMDGLCDGPEAGDLDI